MRLHFKIKTSRKALPFDHLPLLTGTIHKWIGRNNEHGDVSLYSFSQLEGGKASPHGLVFENGTYFFFSSHHPDLIKRIIAGVQADPNMFNDLSVFEMIIQEDPDLNDKEQFAIGSPIFIKRKIDDKIEHILFDDPRANTYLMETLQTKMRKAGLTDDSLNIQFDTNYNKAGTKKITYNGVQNRASWCPVIIQGKPETKLFAWNVGLGNSTGIGFGAIK